jgi:hypothetical protein
MITGDSWARRRLPLLGSDPQVDSEPEKDLQEQIEEGCDTPSTTADRDALAIVVVGVGLVHLFSPPFVV